MTYHLISKYPTVCVLMTIPMGEIIRFQLVSNLYRLSDCKWRLIGKSIAGFRFIDSANVWLPVTSIQARAKSHVTCAEVRKQDRHTSLTPDFGLRFCLKNKFWNLGEKTIPQNSHMSPLLKKNKYLIYPTSVAMATPRRIIDRAHILHILVYF